MGTEDRLAPCRFCGGNSLAMQGWHGLIGIVCTNPNYHRVADTFYTTRAAAIRGWNQRNRRKETA